MKKYVFPLSLISIIFLCAGCPESFIEPDSKLIIMNNSDKKIIFFDQFNSPKDTLLSNFPFNLTLENTNSRIIGPNSSATFPGSYKGILNDYQDDILMLYLFSRDTIERVSWDRIVDEYLILRRYDLTLKDLEDMNWTITYP
ncbi:hypothetical protein MM236_02165 [Belliella sp. DSM 107340]|uniref:Lipoprotein n=1 Tax=Belliella calami TaxID=2923436 RepID=A0ABS9UJH4_9BACT|nr:hypothetical protein [Belliella calami]MCH7396769.1 hypothetical protein [Belliella calami]